MNAPSRRGSNFAAAVLLFIMATLMLLSVRDESATMDEALHVTAGYSYLTEKDYRLNREHPPLSKDIAAVPLYLLVRPKFPTDNKGWTEVVNDQWPIALAFLYESGNDPDEILFASRFPMIVLTLVLGWLFFAWTRRLYGENTAMLALFFFAFSPTVIAHGRYVTTDVAATLGFFIGIVTAISFLQHIGWKSAVIAGIALGFALLVKVSTLLLIPLLALNAAVWIVLNPADARKILLFSFVIAGVGLFIVWIVYAFHIQNYPAERQLQDTKIILSQFKYPQIADLAVRLTTHSLTRPLALYLLAALMAVHNVSLQGPSFFLGDVTIRGWWYYFPVAFVLKEPLPFLLLMIGACLFASWKISRAPNKSKEAIVRWTRDHFATLAILIFVILYWILSMRTKLCIGVRHVLPTFPFLYALVAACIVRVVSGASKFRPRMVLVALLAWLASGTIAAFPYYLSYYNELAGGTWNGYRYVVDSNYDWGQDLKRLTKFVEEKQVGKIGLDYFGGGSPKYYLGSRFVPWSSASGRPDISKGDPEWIGVSIQKLQIAQGQPMGYWTIDPEDRYNWLRGETPVARAGTSIFIYRIGKKNLDEQ